jgi:hypothetical protein
MTGEDRFLEDHFTVGSRKRAPADRAVFALGVFAHHIKVDVARLAPDQRTRHTQHEAHRAQIDVLIELTAKQQQRAPERNMVGHGVGPADCAEIDRIMATDLVFPVGGHHGAVARVVVAACEIEVIEGQVDPEAARRNFEDPQALGHDFLADSVARNDRNLVCCHVS